jgi:hypothetical protein
MDQPAVIGKAQESSHHAIASSPLLLQAHSVDEVLLQQQLLRQSIGRLYQAHLALSQRSRRRITLFADLPHLLKTMASDMHSRTFRFESPGVYSSLQKFRIA